MGWGTGYAKHTSDRDVQEKEGGLEKFREKGGTQNKIKRESNHGRRSDGTKRKRTARLQKRGLQHSTQKTGRNRGNEICIKFKKKWTQSKNCSKRGGGGGGGGLKWGRGGGGMGNW